MEFTRCGIGVNRQPYFVCSDSLTRMARIAIPRNTGNSGDSAVVGSDAFVGLTDGSYG